jgi:hypothetical protein
LEKISLDLEEGKERGIDEESCDCFIDWQKAFDRVNWTRLMQSLNEAGIDWRERRSIRKLYIDQDLKLGLDQGRKVSTGTEIKQRCFLSPILIKLHNE